MINLKIAISYFYQIRNFKPWMIPVSTAVSDPAWYHNFTYDKTFTFLDKRGVVNGLRCEELHGDKNCDGLCLGKNNCKTKNPNECLFLKTYKQQLEKMNINNFIRRAENSLQKIKQQVGFKEEPLLVLMVHEAPSNECSERKILLEYFNSKGIECKELDYPIV